MATPRGRLGRWGEEHARRYLEGKGYTVSETNYRSRWGEVDIVSRLGEELVFVEVKTRRGVAFGTPEESITAAKSQRLIATAQDYLQKNGLEQSRWRIDLISIHLDETGKLLEVNHLENAVGE
ncbi:MAG: YraN family protein [Chloroflexi bacterium]|nr:YraN family protein [Chloroflexota bacterium]MCI0811485.1 YraN family protein [Chloroflexota bacterium]MCI0847266.1 YraN family protein [Chloroflexota bacterium]MCI0897355.1 YraN family protein [Chloroflexota bacterium]MCI0900906.1 YraN family protein [Chloroflexota bacterium]